MDPAHLPHKLSSALEISPLQECPWRKEKAQLGNDLKDWQNTEAVFHTPLRSRKGTEFLEGVVAI